ncbi:MAG: hypothetical protein KJ692_08925 [Verrucomicrobia bacterium]|nr:hypothetical protein [Verrucomicrobiota bacterium]
MSKMQIDLLIITPGEFKASLAPLVSHKNNTGIATELIDLDAVYKLYSGKDEAEKIKKCLVAYRNNNGIRFAMLVGDSDKFPVRYTKTDRKDAKAFDTAFYASDLYYADLFEPNGVMDNWDKNNNGYYGELRGESGTGTLNVDDVDLRPDIAVGRIPASTSAEVKKYVNKVITYETTSYQPAWFKKTLLIATTDWLNDACKTQEEIATKSFTDFSNQKLYSSGNPCGNVTAPSAGKINELMNNGVGFISYIGHGSRTTWHGCYGVNDISGLTNAAKLPIIIASACGTSEFATQAPYDGYTDINGANHNGTNGGEVFAVTPPQPACIQALQNPESIGEALTVKYDTGAIGYIGCVTGAQPWSRDLNKFFFEAYRYGHEFLGGMWSYMIQKFYETHVLPTVIATPDWTKVAEFHQPWKFILFGDPSLRIGGIRTSLGEDCLKIDHGKVQVKKINGRWKIVEGSSWLLDFGGDLTSAILANNIIKHYKFTSQCFVGRPGPSMEYFLSGGKAPVGPFPGEDAIGFNPSAIIVKKVNGRWKIVEGSHWIMDFGASEIEAIKAFAVIQKYGFNKICFVGRPNPPMSYFRR